MFVEPTINDFLDNIRWHLRKAANNASRGVRAAQNRLASVGKAQSGQAIIEIFDAVKSEFDAGIDAALGELKRTLSRTKLDSLELRQATVQCLQNFAIESWALIVTMSAVISAC